ncbi:hypothetical protein JHK87_048418 [Glycine soja]|nr:hypothetical protein JHK87_048418 [Glycine soja]
MLTGMLIELLIILASLAYLAVDAFWSQDFPPQLANLVANDGPIGKCIKEAMVSKGKPLILEKVRVWVHSMATGGGGSWRQNQEANKTTSWYGRRKPDATTPYAIVG